MDQLEQRLIELFKVLLDNSKVDSGAELGKTDNWDSLNHMTLVVAVENMYNISFSSAQIVELTSIKNFVRILKLHNYVH